MIVQARAGQAEAVLLTAQFTDDDGAPATPTSPEVRVYGHDPVALVIGPVTPTEVIAGMMLYELDISNVTTWRAGQYLVRWSGITDGTEGATVDTLQILETGSFASLVPIGGSYTTEARIRAVNKLLEDAENIEPADVALEAWRGAEYINGRLGERYVVPFAAPYPGLITLINDWLAAAYLLDRFHGENGNLSEHARMLREWADTRLDALLAGTESIDAEQPGGSSAGIGAASSSSYSKTWSGTMPNIEPSSKEWRR